MRTQEILEPDDFKKIIKLLTDIKTIVTAKQEEDIPLNKQYKDPKEAAILLRVNIRTIRKYMSNGQLKSIKPAGRRMIPMTEIENFINNKNLK